MAMKILLLTQVLPYPPDSGPKIKTYHVLRYLAERHKVTLVSFIRNADELRAADELRTHCHAVHTIPIQRSIQHEIRGLIASLLSHKPFMMTRDHRGDMTRLLDRLAAENDYDAVHADQLNMAQYALRFPHARKVLDLHNALWVLYRRFWSTMPAGPRKWLLGRDWPLLKRCEGDLCRAFDAVLTVTQEDLDALREAAGTHFEASVIPIAIDTQALQLIDRVPNPRVVLHIGTMYWPPNISGVMWFANEVWPHVKAAVPGARFEVVGSRPPQEVLALEQADPSIHVAGYIADPTEIFQQTAVAIVPVSAGSGMRVKILEAFARGLPTVSTTIGFEGIAVTHEKDLLVADQPEEYARAVIRLLQKPELGRQLSRNARQLVEAQYDYRAACQPLDTVYTRLNEAGRVSSPASAPISRNGSSRENALTQSIPKSGLGD